LKAEYGSDDPADRSATVNGREDGVGRYGIEGGFDEADDFIAIGARGATDSGGESLGFDGIGHGLVTIH
jgi:hypothetical protein